jgi:mono/diheme cytochrome c family protein
MGSARIILFVISCSVLFLSCSDTPYMQGMRLYEAKCANCHMSDGSGLSKLIPSLSTSKLIQNPALSTCLIVNGIQDTIWKDSTYLVKQMPSFKKLSATEVTNIVNYINHKWNPNFVETQIIQVEKILKSCL